MEKVIRNPFLQGWLAVLGVRSFFHSDDPGTIGTFDSDRRALLSDARALSNDAAVAFGRFEEVNSARR